MVDELRARECHAIPYTSIDRFPDFSVASLPALMILPSGQPSIEKARDHSRLFIEARYTRPFRTPYLAQCGVRCGDEHRGQTLAAYSNIRQSRIYPRLRSGIEIEVVAAYKSWLMMARSQHGNQDSFGGIFKFGSYAATHLHVAAWIWFCRRWIGNSWEDDSTRYRVCITKSIETLDLGLLLAIDILESPQMEIELEEAHEVAALEGLFRQ